MAAGANGWVLCAFAFLSTAHAALALGRSPPTGSQVSVWVTAAFAWLALRTVMVSLVVADGFPPPGGRTPGECVPGECEPGGCTSGEPDVGGYAAEGDAVPLGWVTIGGTFLHPLRLSAMAMPDTTTDVFPSLFRDWFMSIRLPPVEWEPGRFTENLASKNAPTFSLENATIPCYVRHAMAQPSRRPQNLL